MTCAGEDTQFIPIAQAAASDEEWTLLAGELSLPNCALQTVAVYVEGPAPEIDVYVDDLALREQPLPNLIANGSFETGTSGWFGWGPSVIGVTTDAFSGSQAAIASGRTADWNGIATNLTGIVQPLGVYQATAFAKIAGATSAPLALTAQIQCQGGAATFVRVASATGSDTGCSELTGSFTLPNCTPADVNLYVEGPPAGVDILVDDVSLSPIESNEGRNIIANAGFESGTGGWFPFGAVTISDSTARAHSGLRGAHHEPYGELQRNRDEPARRGDPRPHVQRPRLRSGRQGRERRRSLHAAGPVQRRGQTFTTLASATASDGAWVELVGTLTVPNCTLTTANFYLEGPAAGVDLYLDDVSVREQL